MPSRALHRGQASKNAATDGLKSVPQRSHLNILPPLRARQLRSAVSARLSANDLIRDIPVLLARQTSFPARFENEVLGLKSACQRKLCPNLSSAAIADHLEPTG